MSQGYNDDTKRPKPQDTQLGILKVVAFYWGIKQRALGPGESAAKVAYQSMRIHPKSCPIFPLKVTTTLLNGSRKSAVGV